MSRAIVKVKFPDGEIRYGIYNGTVDFFCSPLFETQDKAWNFWNEYKSSSFNSSKFSNPYDELYYDVEIADDYGSGTTYIGRASKSEIVSALKAEYMNEIKNGLPDWWNDDEKSLEVTPSHKTDGK